MIYVRDFIILAACFTVGYLLALQVHKPESKSFLIEMVELQPAHKTIIGEATVSEDGDCVSFSGENYQVRIVRER